MKLTEAESIARKSFLLLITESTQSECDSELFNIDLPSWYDEEKYTRAQKFYIKNRMGILSASVNGVITGMADNKSLKILASTGKSSTKETAGRRYVSTIQHFMIWYEKALTVSNSVSLQSLDKVRKLHVLNSKKAKENGLGAITQFQLVLTAFGFYAFAIFRSHLFGIPDNNQEDREGFIHFWAVVSRMTGIRDKFNICLLPFDVLEILYQMIIRYIFLPLIQDQKPLHIQMMTALIDGFGQYSSTDFGQYDSQIFITRMICGVPGYQYGCDLTKEILSRSDILRKKDIFACNKILKKILGEDFFEITYNIPVAIKNLKNDQIQLKYVNYEDDWQSILNDSKFYEMQNKAKSFVRMRYYFSKLYKFSIFKYLMEFCASWDITRMKKIKF